MSKAEQIRCSSGCRLCRDNGHAVIEMLGLRALGQLDAVRRRHSVAPGETVFSQGDRPSGLHCIESGLLALRSLNRDGTQVLIGLRRRGDMIGYASFLSDTPNDVTAEALVPTRLCTIPAGPARALMLSDAQFAGMLTHCSLREAQAHRARMVAFAGHDNETRLCMVLAALVAESEATGPMVRLDLPLSRADLASILSVAPETLSRVLARLRKKGILMLTGRELVVHCLAQLQEIAGGQGNPALAGFMSPPASRDKRGAAAVGC